VVGGEFTPGVENVSADGLSRGRTIEEVRPTDRRMTSDTTLFILAQKIFELCYPLRKDLSDAQFIVGSCCGGYRCSLRHRAIAPHSLSTHYLTPLFCSL
jgi:hypothetical protein